MRHYNPLFVVIVFVFTLSGIGHVIAGGGFSALEYDGIERNYYLHVPESYDESQPTPLLIALHARSSSGRTMAILTGLDDAADENGYLAVFPDGVDAAWGEDATDPDLADDVGFIGALIDHLSESYTIDPERVYLAGYANGGSMAYRLACETPQRFASVAVVGPLMWGYHAENCPESATVPVNLLIVRGSEDHFYTVDTHTYATLGGEEAYPILGVDDTLEFWATRNGCDLDTVSAGGSDDHIRAYDTCEDDVTVAFYTVQGAGLNWPHVGDYSLNQFGVDATTMITQFFAGDEAWATPQTEPFDGQARTYIAYVPTSYDPAQPTPLVLTLHGRYGSGAGTAAHTRMNDIAEQNGFIALYPDGLPYPQATYPYDTGWNYYWGLPGFDDDVPHDAAFLSALIDDLSVDLNIDQERVYVSGHSNGGFMVHHLACNDAERYAAFATVAGSGYYGMWDNCQDSTPVPMLIIHGTYDDNVLWRGRSRTVNGREVYDSYPIVDMFGFWLQHNGCDLEDSEVSEIPPGGQSPETTVRIMAANDCPDNASVILYGVLGGGHNWPGVPTDWGGAGNINMDINAGQVIWEFFAGHTREAAE